MRSIMAFFTRRKAPATLKREFAVAAFTVWFGISLRLFASGDAEWIAAQGVNYGTLTSAVWLFITASVGIQAWQNQQDGPPAARPTAPDFETGDQPRELTPEERLRNAG